MIFMTNLIVTNELLARPKKTESSLKQEAQTGIAD